MRNDLNGAKKRTVALLFGGISEEHAVSVKSAREISACLDKNRYRVINIGISRQGDWRLCGEIRLGFGERTNPRVILSPARMGGGVYIMDGAGGIKPLPIDIIFPVLHGKGGEDGTVQGLLELSGIPYVGCGAQSSVLCMDKSLTYMTAAAAGFLTPKFTVLREGENPPENPSFPLFCKPARSGSSFGVTRVEDKSELPSAIKEARRYDSKILLEEAVQAAEVGVAILGKGDGLCAGEVDMITLKRGFFRIHQEPRPEDGSENAAITVPAPLPPQQRGEIIETAKGIYRALGCRGLARVDLFLLNDGRLMLNEVNTMPGFTSYSRYPRMMKAAGITLSEVAERLIELAFSDDSGVYQE